MFKKLFGLVAALLFSVAAHAAFPPVATTGYNCGYAPGYHATVEEAFAGWGGMGQPNVSGPYYWSSGSCVAFINGNPSAFQGSVSTIYSCPANATLVGGECVCNSGYGENGSSCINEQCQVGQGRTFNRTEGWARSANANADDVVVDNGGPGSPYGYNDGVCVGDLARVDRCYRSQEPSTQGLYRISCDYTMIVSGESTSPGDANADPENDNAICPGVVGTVNGKAMCVGNASNPLPSPSPAPNQPTSAGNPSAGAKPATGEGSGSSGAGRTPTGGSGGNDGGPASAAVGRGGTGDRGESGEDGTAVCGAPPLPACNVKVDETGTPAEGTAEGRFSTAGAGVDEQKGIIDGLFNTIESWTIGGWTWTFAFPTGCTPMTIDILGEIEVDPCQWQGHIHGLMSIIWVLTGICAAFVIFERGAA